MVIVMVTVSGHMQHLDQSCVLIAIAVPGVDREILVAIMETHLTIQPQHPVSVHFEAAVFGEKDKPCASGAVMKYHCNVKTKRK